VIRYSVGECRSDRGKLTALMVFDTLVAHNVVAVIARKGLKQDNRRRDMTDDELRSEAECIREELERAHREHVNGGSAASGG
jgi:hypothetical protein